MSCASPNRLIGSSATLRRTVVTLASAGLVALSSAAVAQAYPRPSIGAHATSSATRAPRSSVVKVNPAAAATLYVQTTGSDTGNTCRISSNPCLTIGHAISESQAGDTIDVGKGIYPEQLEISTDVNIVGAAATGSNATIIEPTTVNANQTDPEGGTADAPIVEFEPGTTGNLSQLQINGSAGGGGLTSCADNYIGAYYRDASGTLTNVDITSVQQGPAYFGCQGGTNVYAVTDADSATPSNVVMSKLTITAYQKNGITCDEPGTVCTITGSTITGLGPIPTTAENGIQIFGASATIKSTTVSGNSYTSPLYDPADPNTYYTASGILVINAGGLTISGDKVRSNDANIYAMWYPSYGEVPSGGQGTWSITGNTVTSATNNTGASGTTRVPFGNGFGDGIDLDGTGLSGSTTVSGNFVGFGAEFGIGLFDATGATVEGNWSLLNKGDGIFVGDLPATGTSGIAANSGPSTANTLSDNRASLNTLDGILADGTSATNTFTSNSLFYNFRYDAEDASVGGGNDGTANTWTSNACSPKNDGSPELLCHS